MWAALVVLAALAAVYRSDDNDYWFHLAAGRSVSQHGLPAEETWCLAARGRPPWLSEWLFHVTLYQVHRLGGDLGVALWRASWTALAMVLAIRLLHLLGAATWGAVMLAPLVLAVARDRFQPRPEQIFLVIVLLSIVLYETARKTGRDRTRWLIPVQALWSNLQGSWLFGPAIAWVYAAGAWWDERSAAARAKRSAQTAASAAPGAEAAAPANGPFLSRATLWGALGLVLWAASAIVPRPLETLARPFQFLLDLGFDPLTGTIEELRGWSWATDRREPFTLLLVIGLGALLLGGRRMWRISPSLLAITIGAYVLGILGVRFRGLAAWLAYAPLAVALAPRGRGLGRLLWSAPSLVVGLAGMGWLVTAPQFTFGIRPQLYAVPVRAAAVAESLGLHGPYLNTFHHGGYLLWARGEDDPPLIDGRGRGSFEFRSLYARAHLYPQALDELIHAWDFRYVLVEPPQSPDQRLAIELSRRLEWARIFYDDAGVLFVRWSRDPELARARAYRYFTPDYTEMSSLGQRCLADTGLARLVEAELHRARAESPWHAHASLWLGLLALGRGNAPEAVRYLRDVERLAPATPGLAYRLGMAYEQIGDKKMARRAYRRALANPDDAEMARESLRGLSGD